MRMSEVHSPPEVDESQDRVVGMANKSVSLPVNYALATLLTSTIKEDDIVVDKVSILEVIQERALVKDEPTSEINHPTPSTNEDHLREEITSKKGINVIPFILFMLFIHVFSCTELLFINATTKEEVPTRQDPIAIPPMCHGKIFFLL